MSIERQIHFIMFIERPFISSSYIYNLIWNKFRATITYTLNRDLSFRKCLSSAEEVVCAVQNFIIPENVSSRDRKVISATTTTGRCKNI